MREAGVLLFLFFCPYLSQQTTLIRQDLSEYELARCNDGTAAAYFYQQDSRFSNGDVMIYLPDGGQCGSVEDCRERCDENGEGRSKCTSPRQQVLEKNEGIWSSDFEVNPFVDHFKVFLHYCTSDNYAGTRGASRATGNLFFHGKHVITAMLEDLSLKFGLDTAASLTLVGTGSGARGVGYNCDYVASLLPGVPVRCLADSPDMVPWWVKTENCDKRDYEKEEGEKILWGREDDESCVAEFKAEVNSSELAHRCGVWSRYWSHIDTPFFILGTQFDPSSFASSPCLPATSAPEYLEYELAWRRGVAALYESQLLANQSLFVSDCRAHGFLDGALSDARLARLSAPNLENNQTISLMSSLNIWLRNPNARLNAIDSVAAGNLECPGPEPLCKSKSGCSSGPSYYPSVRRRLLPPSYIFPSGYDRRYGSRIDPWYNVNHANSIGRRSRLLKRLQVLRYLRELYNRHKINYAREYYGNDGVYDGGVLLAGRGGVLGGRRRFPALAGTDLIDLLGGGGNSGVLGGVGGGVLGGGFGGVLDYNSDYDYNDYDYGLVGGCTTCTGSSSRGILARIQDAIRSRKKERSGNRDTTAADSGRPSFDADFDELEDVEDFGPVLVEKIRQN